MLVTIRSLCFLVLAALLLAGLASAPAASQESTLITEVIQMLEAQLSEEIILEWLEDQSAPPALEADDLVALKKAGASDDLMKLLIARTRAGGKAKAASSAPAPASAPELKSEQTAPAAPAVEPTGSGTPVTFHLSYLPQIEEDEIGSDRPWDFYVYIDGFPVTYMPSAEIQNRAETMEFARTLPPGQHTIRVAQERHFEQRGKWHHETRAGSPSFEFELMPDLSARLEVQFHERLMDYQDPLMFLLTQDNRVLDSGRIGGEAEFWPALCFDVQASIQSGKKPSRQQRQRLERCVEWEAWWKGRSVPSRQEVLDAMAVFDYRPRPKGS